MVISKSKEFKKFFEEFFVPVCRFTEHYIGEKEEAADIAQEVFVKVYEKWEEFKEEENARAFLYTVARHLCLNWLKHKRVSENYISHYDTLAEEKEEFFLKEVTRRETLRIFYAAVDRLPGQTRQVILYSLEGFSVQEVGEKMKISVNTVKTLKKKAYIALRQSLSRECLLFLFMLMKKAGPL